MARKGEMGGAKSAAAFLKRKGILHGMRQSRPFPNSGGLTMTGGPGSAAYQRRAPQRKG